MPKDPIIAVKMAPEFCADLENCVRCGGNHQDLIFKKFNQDSQFNYWTTCPITGEPMLANVPGDKITQSLTSQHNAESFGSVKFRKYLYSEDDEDFEVLLYGTQIRRVSDGTLKEPSASHKEHSGS